MDKYLGWELDIVTSFPVSETKKCVMKKIRSSAPRIPKDAPDADHLILPEFLKYFYDTFSSIFSS